MKMKVMQGSTVVFYIQLPEGMTAQQLLEQCNVIIDGEKETN